MEDIKITRLREVRKALGLTQTEMGNLMEVSMDTYSAIERGVRKLQPKHLNKLEGTKVNIWYIMEGKGAPLKDEKRERFIDMLDKLTPEQRAIIENLIENFARTTKDEG